MAKFGIEDVAAFIPNNYLPGAGRFAEVSNETIKKSIGIRKVSRLPEDKTALSLCVEAFLKIRPRIEDRLSEVDLIVVVSHQIHQEIPHLSSQLHGALDFPERVICFDFALGCSGFVQGVAAVEGIMQKFNFRSALLFNVEVLSKVLDPLEANTNLIFGDAASCALLSNRPRWSAIGYKMGTLGKAGQNLGLGERGLAMDGPKIYDFAVRNVPKSIKGLLVECDFTVSDVNYFALHQASLRVVQKIAEMLLVDFSKCPFVATEYGNLGSVSIPAVLETLILREDLKSIVISGFGSGLAWASALLIKENYNHGEK